MTSIRPEGLALRLLDHEKPPDYPMECLEFLATVSMGGFLGSARFSVMKRDLDRFLGELDTMARDLSGEACLRSGWGETVHFEMKAFYFDRRGHIAVELELADHGRRERMRRLTTDLVTEPELLGSFAAKWRRAAKDDERDEITLAASAAEH